MSLNEKRQFILENARDENVKYVRLMFTDLMGTIKNVEVPVSQLETALDGKVMFDGSSIEGFVRIQEADMFLKPDFNSWLILSWEKTTYGKVARLICDVYKTDGTPFEGDPRTILRRNLAKMKDLEFSSFNVGVEPEFFLFKLDEKGEPTLEFNDRGGYFDLAPIDGAEDCRRDIVLELEKVGYEVEASHHEVAQGQHEINFKYANALELCDKLQTFKLIVKTIAKRHGLHATFMPKPIAKINGSGMHVNCSLFDNEGNNVFNDPNGELGLSEIARNWIAGIMKHARSFTAITNPSVNSYKRLIPGYEAPCYVSWSDANRSAMIRIPASRGVGTRTEIRSVDPSTNPYLALSVILSAGLDGVVNKLASVDPVYLNLYELSREQRESMGILNLPGTLKDAVKELKKSDFMKESLGQHAFEKFIQAKTKEWNDYRVAVHDWEIKRYLKQY